MDDLISRQAAKLAVVEKGQASKRYKLGEFWELNRDEIWDALDSVPSAQQERKTGKWIKYDLTPMIPYQYSCSNCGAYHRVKYDFCPSCGADMRGEQNE